MAETRLARDLETRGTTQRKAAWRQPDLLPTPQEQEGYKFRWIRTSLLGQVDPTNTSAKLREGWTPVRAEDHPEMQVLSDPSSRFKDNIEVGGLLLCKAPVEMVQQRNDYYARQAESQNEAVDNSFMKQSDARMPLFNEKKTEVRFGKGSR